MYPVPDSGNWPLSEPDSSPDPYQLPVVAWFTTAGQDGRDGSPAARVADIVSPSSGPSAETESLPDLSPVPVLGPVLK